MENIETDSDYIPSSTTSYSEYDSENDDFLLHRDSDELSAIMNEYKDVIKINLYKHIELKVKPKDNTELEEILLFLISKGIDFDKDIHFITE